MKRVLLLIAVVIFLSGCTSSIKRMHNGKNYAGIIGTVKGKKYDSLLGMNLVPVCQSLLKLQKYDEFFKCHSALKENAKNHNGKILYDKYTLDPDKYYSKAYTTYLLDILLAKAHLSLGNVKFAMKHAENSLAQIDSGNDFSISHDYGSFGKSMSNVLSFGLRHSKTNEDKILKTFENVALLATIYATIKNKEKAYEMLDRIKEIRKKKTVFRTQVLREHAIAEIFAKAHFSLGDYNDSLKYSKIALDEIKPGVFANVFLTVVSPIAHLTSGYVTGNTLLSPDEGVKLFSMEIRAIKGRSELEVGKLSAAKKTFDEMLNYPLFSGLTNLHYLVLYDRGRVAEKEGNYASASDFYKRSIEVIEESRSSIKSENLKIGYVGDKQNVYNSLVKVLIKQNKFSSAFEYVERGKARALVDLLASKSNFKNSSNQNIVSNKTTKDVLMLAEEKVTSKNIVERVKTRGADRGLLLKAKKQLIQKTPEYASLVTAVPPKASEIQKLLPDGEVLLEYYGNKDEMVVFAVTNKDISTVDVNANGLHSLIKSYRKALHNIKSNEYKDISKKLYDKLIKPISPKLSGARGLTIVPHGALHYLPFNSLYTGNHFLIDQAPLSILPSATVMKFLKAQRHTQENILVLGNPDLKDAELDLPGAQQEAIAIAKQRTNSHLLLRSQATETAIKNNGGAYKYLHLASHGVFDPAKPLNSSLLLSKDAANDGQLTVSELYDLNLNAELVTLSACETALGKVTNGDDVVGFTRGFLYAGVNSIVSSLWKVDDTATNTLMQSFYTNMRSMGKRSALVKAQQNVKKKYPHPYYWAAFQLTGKI